MTLLLEVFVELILMILLDNLQLLLRKPDTSSSNPSTSRCKVTRDVHESFHVAHKVQKDTGAPVYADDMEVFSVA
jgi:hypothetical protein